MNRARAPREIGGGARTREGSTQRELEARPILAPPCEAAGEGARAPGRKEREREGADSSAGWWWLPRALWPIRRKGLTFWR
jgi:hypothetical protein